MELTGFEPVASSMPWKRATNCAIAPCSPSHPRTSPDSSQPSADRGNRAPATLIQDKGGLPVQTGSNLVVRLHPPVLTAGPHVDPAAIRQPTEAAGVAVVKAHQQQGSDPQR